MINTAGLPSTIPAARTFSTESLTHAMSEAEPRTHCVANDERPVVVGLEQLVGRAQPPRLAVVRQFALGPVRVGAGKDGAHVFETDAEIAHLRGFSSTRTPGSALPPT